jgi:hypothetical protein
VGAAAAVERGKASGATVVVASGSGSGAGAAAEPGKAAEARVAASSAALAEGSRRFARGAGRFISSLWKPFAHATGLLGLQITGLLFAFFALGFGAKCWQLYRDAGWRDHYLPMYVAFAALFIWFAVSSFWRASRKQKRG